MAILIIIPLKQVIPPEDEWSPGASFLYHLPGTSEFNASIVAFLEAVRTQTASDAEFRAFLHMLCYNPGAINALTPILKVTERRSARCWRG